MERNVLQLPYAAAGGGGDDGAERWMGAGGCGGGSCWEGMDKDGVGRGGVMVVLLWKVEEDESVVGRREGVVGMVVVVVGSEAEEDGGSEREGIAAAADGDAVLGREVAGGTWGSRVEEEELDWYLIGAEMGEIGVSVVREEGVGRGAV